MSVYALCSLVLERCGDEFRILRVGATASSDNTVLEGNALTFELRGEGPGELGVIGGEGGVL